MKLLVAVLFLGAAWATNPGVRIQLNQQGLDYAKGIGMQVLNKDIKTVQIPDISGSESILQYKLSNFRILSFTAYNSKTSVRLQRPNSITLASSDIGAHITADYNIKVGSGWFSISKSGSVDMTASQTSFSQQIAITQYNGKPHVNAGHCSASCNSLSIHFNGGIVDDIINLFDGIIENYVKGKISGIICSEVPNLINGLANKELNKLPTSIDLGSGFNLDYSLTNSPSVSSDNLEVTIPFLGELWYTGHHNDANIPSPRVMPLVHGSPKMACIEVQPLGVVGSLAYAAKVAGYLNFYLTAEMVKEYHLSQYFKCSCPGSKCFGTIIPQIHDACQNGTVEVSMISSQIPLAEANSTGIFLTDLGWDLEFKGKLTNGKVVSLFTAAVTASAVVPAPIKFEGWKISGQVHMTGAALTIKSSNIGTLDQQGLQQLWQIALITVVEGKLNQVAQAGIPLPQIPDVNVLQPTVAMGQHEVTVCCDLQYTGPIFIQDKQVFKVTHY